MYIYIHLYICIKFPAFLWFIVRGWLIWWWRLVSSRGYSWQAWRPRKAEGIVSVWAWSPKNQESQWYKSQSEFKSRKRPVSQLGEAQAERANSLLPASCSFQTPQGLDKAFPNCRRQSAFLSLLTQMLISPRNTFPDTYSQTHPEYHLTESLGTPWSPVGWHVRLTLPVELKMIAAKEAGKISIWLLKLTQWDIPQSCKERVKSLGDWKKWQKCPSS